MVIEGNPNYPLQIAATLGTPDLVEKVLESGADPNLKIGGYSLVMSLLSFASEKTLPQMYKMSFGVEPDNPKEIAKLYREIVKVLIRHGANTDIVDETSGLSFLDIVTGLEMNDILELIKSMKQ